MKKGMALILALALCLSMTACFKSEEAKTVETLIENIGTITLEDYAGLTTAQEAYEQLTAEQKAEVANYAALEEAKATLAELNNKQAASEIDALIEAVGTVSLNSKSAIAAAQEAYDAATAEVQAFVSKLDVLEAAKGELNKLYQNEADNVSAKISAIGTVTLESGAAIDAVQEAYDALGEESKALVKNLDVLTSAAASYKALCKEKADAMLSSMRVESDAVRGIKFYYPSAFPFYTEYWGADVRCFVLPYLGMQGNSVWLRLVCDYTADDWIFFEKITFAVDDARYYKYFSYYDVTRDNAYGDIWEYVDIDVGSEEIELLRAIANSETTIVRFEGDDYYDDFTVSQKDKEAIKQMLIIYDAYN